MYFIALRNGPRSDERGRADVMGWAALLGVLRRPAGRGAGSTRQGPL